MQRDIIDPKLAPGDSALFHKLRLAQPVTLFHVCYTIRQLERISSKVGTFHTPTFVVFNDSLYYFSPACVGDSKVVLPSPLVIKCFINFLFLQCNYMIALIVYGEDFKLWSFYILNYPMPSLMNRFSAPFSNISICTLLPNTLNII